MTMIDMKQTAEEAQENSPEVGQDAPMYPYGLRISLDDGALEKLGVTTLPKVGSKIQITAMCEVCSTSEYSDQAGEKEANVSLQITAMELGSEQEEQTSASIASALYGS